MNKEATKYSNIKKSISNLFILRDSCQGTCMTQKDNPNIIWFEGATILLQQSVDNLNSAYRKIDSGDKDAKKVFAQKVKETLSKLTVLQRSSIITRSEDMEENVIWFEGADYMISDVINELQSILQQNEIPVVSQSASAESESDDSEPEEEAEEEEEEEEEEGELESDDDAPKKRKKTSA